MSTDVANIAARLRLDSSEFERGIGRAARVAGAIALTGVAAAAGIISTLTSRAMESLDAQAKAADMLGESIEKMAGYGVAARLAGIEQESFNKALRDGQRRISEAASGTGSAVDALEQLGLSAAALNQLSPGQQLETVAAALQNVGNANERARILYDVFGRSGQQLINIIKGGADAFAEAQEFADAAGFAINRIDAAKIEAANDEVSKLGMLFEGLGNQIAVRVAPMIAGAAQVMIGFALDGTTTAERVAEAFRVVEFTIGRIGDTIDALKATWWSLIGSLQAGLSEWVGASAKLLDFIPGAEAWANSYHNLSQTLAQNAEESFERAGAALENIWSGGNDAGVRQFFGEIESRAAAAAAQIAEQADATRAATAEFGAMEKAGDKAKAKTRTARDPGFLQFDSANISARGLSQLNREQTVRDPQLQTTNSLLRDLVDSAQRQPGAVYA